jgi:hypothetical protein
VRHQILRTVVIVTLWFLVSAVTMECLYRLFLYKKFPDRFVNPQLHNPIVVYDQPMWQYDSQFGYAYPSEFRMAATIIEDGRVTYCGEEGNANKQGNIGPSVPDFSTADYRIVVFGDSFSASAIDDKPWPSILQSKLDSGRGKTVRVLNLARDGYGILQMFDLAAAKIPQLRPTLVIFALNYGALRQDRKWRVLVGSGDDARLVVTKQNSTNPDILQSSDMLLLMPSATRQWCKSTLGKSPAEQAQDSILKRILQKYRYIRSQNPLRLAKIYDFNSSYIYDRIVHKDQFYTQWRNWENLRPGTNPVVNYNDFRQDQSFVKAVTAVNATRIPYVIVHLPQGVHVKAKREFDASFEASSENTSLMRSLEKVTGHPVIEMLPYLSISHEDGMLMCVKPDNCHPSTFGMITYADAIKKIIEQNRIPGAPH